MRLKIALVVPGMFAVAFSAVAQEIALPDVAAPESGNLWSRQGWVQLAIFSGRIEGSVNSSGSVREDVGDRHEELAVDGGESGSSARYDSISPREHFSVEMMPGESANQRIVIRWEQMVAATDKGDAEPKRADAALNPSAKVDKEIAELRQASDGLLVFTTTKAGLTKKFQAPSLWQLLITQPEICKQHLVPMLQRLRGDWQLDRVAADARQELLHGAAEEHVGQKARWAALVAGLADSRFAVRERSDRELHAAGREAIPYLQNLKRRDLDAEQWRRISDLIASYDDAGEDTAESIAQRLRGDRSLWLALLSDEQGSTRSIAAKQLSMLLGKKIDFNPAADVATRQQQIESLKSTLGK